MNKFSNIFILVLCVVPISLYAGNPTTKEYVDQQDQSVKTQLEIEIKESEGKPGPRGPQGEKGDTGPKGDKGDVGPMGPKGDIGPQGEIGPRGEKGNKGDIGPAGPKGDKGDLGPIGPKGDKGDIGPEGSKGDKGDIGPAGPKGDKGDIGPEGQKGDKGDIGPAGPKGDIGPQGETGPRGEKGEIGPAGPIGPRGEPGQPGPKGDPGSSYVAGNGIELINNTISMKPLKIGQYYQGGIIFWLDPTTQHGLMVAKTDQSSGIAWKNTATNRVTNAIAMGLKSGLMNTFLITSILTNNNPNGSFAALVASSYSISENGITFGGWFLPSIEELKIIYSQKVLIDIAAMSNGGTAFSLENYWSSTEADSGTAWSQHFGSAAQSMSDKSSVFRVRAVREF